ncbi:hypothetical protein KR018_008261 [Drosophila ironensis]|nr:hypothetical protein KR018_008261 [Drosophila ironensis]
MALIYGTEKQTLPNYMKYVLGGASGMLATSLVQPLDLVKTRMQLSGTLGVREYRSSFDILGRVLRREGTVALYNGLSAGLMKQATYTTARMGFYQMEMDLYCRQFDANPSLVGAMVMGVMAGAVGAAIGNPSELVLTRMMADNRLPLGERRNYKNVGQAFGRIVREEGVATLWRGCFPSVARAMVVNMVQLSSYMQLKKQLKPYLDDGLRLHASAALGSGLLTAMASMPIDMAKTRIQQMGEINGKPEYTGTIDVFAKVMRNEGFLSLWKGFTPYLCRVGPHTVLSFIFLEQMHKAYHKLFLSSNPESPDSGS